MESATKAGRKRKREALWSVSSGEVRVVVTWARRAVWVRVGELKWGRWMGSGVNRKSEIHLGEMKERSFWRIEGACGGGGRFAGRYVERESRSEEEGGSSRMKVMTGGGGAVQVARFGCGSRVVRWRSQEA